MNLISIKEWREKHKKDYKHVKSGYVSGNPKYRQPNKQTVSGKAGETRNFFKSQDRKTTDEDK